MKIECGRDVSETEPMYVEYTTNQSLRIVGHFMEQGAVRGFFYGAGVGVFLWIIGAIFGCAIGGAAGMVLGVLDGVVLAFLEANYRRNSRSTREFMTTASWLAPLITFCTTMIVCAVVITSGDPDGFIVALQTEAAHTILMICAVPAVIATFATWQSVRKMDEWFTL